VLEFIIIITIIIIQRGEVGEAGITGGVAIVRPGVEAVALLMRPPKMRSSGELAAIVKLISHTPLPRKPLLLALAFAPDQA